MKVIKVKLVETSATKPFYGTVDKVSYAVNIAKIPDGNGFPQMPFGRQLDAMRFVKNWQADAKSAHVNAKGKPTMKAVKEWVALNKPSEFYAKWKADSSNYKDDSVQIFYK